MATNSGVVVSAAKLDQDVKALGVTLQRIVDIVEQQRKAQYETELRMNFIVKVFEESVGSEEIGARWNEYIRATRGGVIDGVMEGTLDVTRYGV